MTSIVFYFQLHQPYRLRRFGRSDVGRGKPYFDDGENERIVRRVAHRCYLPMNALLEQAIERTGGRFRCAFSLSGTVLMQLEEWAPEVLESFARLARTGSVEFLGETLCHSLSGLADREEFEWQVRAQERRIERLCGVAPRAFRNTELVIEAGLARCIEGLGFDVLLGEGTELLLGERSPHRVYRPAGCGSLRLLLRDYRFSDDIAFRFSNPEWPDYPLMADRYAGWLHRLREPGGERPDFVGLFMDYETFGEHQGAHTGVLGFMEHLPGFVLEDPHFDFATPSEAAARYGARTQDLAIPRPFSWADEERDLSAWLGNPMQEAAHEKLYALAPGVRAAAVRGHPELAEDWRKLTTSDHVYYMSTKRESDRDVHDYFSPYESPHQAFVVFMNVLDDLTLRVDAALDADRSRALEATRSRKPR